jgi:formylglycine-generating enzyme required for sulfatase activity
MKYELTQGHYASFLNSLDSASVILHNNTTENEYTRYRGVIKREEGGFRAVSNNRPCNFISWDDAMAFADWAGLRPYTELEFTKAARGPGVPVSHDFPWGTASKDRVSRYVNENGDLVFSEGLDESGLNDHNKDVYAASYYWVMDLAGSVWERVITIGDRVGRNFKG